MGDVDGEPHPWKAAKAAAQQAGVAPTFILDCMQVLESRWKAADGFTVLGSEAAETWVQQRALRRLQGKASDVAAGIRRSAT